MKPNKIYWFLMVFVSSLVLSCGVSQSMAEDEQPSPPEAAEIETVGQESEEPLVHFETEGDFFLGYRWVSTEDSLKAAEYIYPHSSASFGLDLLSCPLPYRYHVNTEFISKYDYYLDGGFAYKDLILFRDILVGVNHNLEHYNYQYAGEPPGLVYTDRDPIDYYYKHFVSNLSSLRLKAPDFPFHTFITHRHVEREGRIQQRFMLGYFNDLNLVSESRDVDWKSNAVILGANSHLGPVEIEYAYDQAKFDPGRNNILYDSYNAYNPDPPGIPRPADTYIHNAIPETESSGHSIKAHSSYTGGIVAAATLSNLMQKNNYSLTESTTWKGTFDFSWIPDPVISIFFKYRHRDVDMDNPSIFRLIGGSGLNPPIDYSVRQGISYDKDVFSLSSRYKPLQRLSLIAKYEFSQIERKDVEEWKLLPPKTKSHTINLTAHANPTAQVKLKAIYEYKNYDQPPYNTTPDNSNRLALTTTYLPVPWLNLYLEYELYLSELDSLRYLNNDPAVLLNTGARDNRQDQVLASLTTTVSPKISMTLSWFYRHYNIEQDLAYGKWADPPNIGQGDYPYRAVGVPYTDKANTFAIAFNWLPREDISLTADLSYTTTKGETEYTNVAGVTPISLSTLFNLEDSATNLEAEETAFSLDLTKNFSNAWEIGLRSYLNIYNDKTSGLLDGNVFTTTFLVKRYF